MVQKAVGLGLRVCLIWASYSPLKRSASLGLWEERGGGGGKKKKRKKGREEDLKAVGILCASCMLKI